MSKNNVNGGIGLTGLLTIVFIVLKLCQTIDWSWWWVLSPLWLPAAVILAVFLIINVVLGLLGNWNMRWKRH